MDTTDELGRILKIRAGEKTQFYDLVRPYENTLYVIGLAILGCPEDAEQVVLGTALKAYKALDQFSPDEKFSTWLLRIGLEEAIYRRFRCDSSCR